MNCLIIFSVLAAVADCSIPLDHPPSLLEAGKPSNSSCEKWKLFQSNKGCLEKYIKRLLPAEVNMSTHVLRPPKVPTTVTMAPAALNVTVTTATNGVTPSTPVTINIDTPPERNVSIPEMDCLCLEDVKERYSKNLMAYQINKNFSKTYLEKLQIGQDVRFDLFDRVFQKSKLRDLKIVDLHCIRVKKTELKDKCLLKILKTTDAKAMFRNITFSMSRLKTYKLWKETCDLSPRLNVCVKRVLTDCPKALEMIASIENVTSEKCKDILNPPPTVSKRKGLPTIVIIFIVIACVCGIAAVACAVFKYLKIRRSRGKLEADQNNAEECEMTTRSKPMN